MRGLIEAVWGYAITCHKAKARSGRTSSSTTTASAARPRTGPAGSTPRSPAPSAASCCLIDLNDARPIHVTPQVRYDLDAIVARLRATAEIWVPRLFPNGRRVGDEWRLANIKGAAPRKKGSCVIALKGEHAGDWHDFDGGQGGGPLSTLEEATGLKGRDLFAHAAELIGWSPGAPNRQEPPAPTAAKQERDTAREIAFILKHAGPLAGTPAETYLASRGLVVPEGTDLLAHADLTHWETKSGYPALIGVVRDQGGETIAIHRTYLQCDAAQPDRVAKATVPSPAWCWARTAAAQCGSRPSVKTACSRSAKASRPGSPS